MPLYMISYDEHPSRNYDECYKLMARWKAKRLLQSLWFAQLTGPAEVVRNAVSTAFGHSASVAVVQVFANGDWSTYGAQDGGVKWLQAHMNS
jgi:hypothetical protein